MLTFRFQVITLELHCSLCHTRLTKTLDVKGTPAILCLCTELCPECHSTGSFGSWTTDGCPSAPQASRNSLFKLVLPHSVATLSSSLCSLQASEHHPPPPGCLSLPTDGHSPSFPGITVARGQELPTSLRQIQLLPHSPVPFPLVLQELPPHRPHLDPHLGSHLLPPQKGRGSHVPPLRCLLHPSALCLFLSPLLS